MKCLYDIYTEGKATQCSGMGYFIVFGVLLSPQYFFQGNFNIYFEYYFSICCLFNIYYFN